MKKALLLNAQVREHTGTRHAEKFRREGLIPAVVYGHKKETRSIALDAHTFVEGLHHGSRLMDVQIGNEKEKMLVKDIQYDHLGRKIIHVDLMRVDVTETVKVMVPLDLKGIAKGAHEGGVVEEHANRLEVECKVTEIPDVITVWIKDVGIGDTIHARDVELPPAVKLVSPPETLLVTCHVIATVKTTEEIEAEAPVAPEVITEVKPEEEEEAAEE